MPPDPWEFVLVPLGLRIRGPLPAKGTQEGVLWQTCRMFSGRNAEKVVYTMS